MLLGAAQALPIGTRATSAIRASALPVRFIDLSSNGIGLYPLSGGNVTSPLHSLRKHYDEEGVRGDGRTETAAHRDCRRSGPGESDGRVAAPGYAGRAGHHSAVASSSRRS